MNKRVAHLALVFGLAGAVSALSVGCGSDDSPTEPSAGSGGKAGSGGGKAGGGSGGKSGAANNGGSGGDLGPAGSAGVDQGGDAAGAGGDQGEVAGSSSGGEGGEGGARGPVHGPYTPEQIARGTVLVRSMAQCGGCHTASDTGSLELGGNPKFANSTLPAPNLTDDPAGIGDWTDAQVINAFRNGIDDEGRQLASAMPYWLFHNMSDQDAQAIVAFLRSLPHASVEVGASNVAATPVTPLAPSALPDTTLPSTDAAYAEAQTGKYLVSGVTLCVRCHSPSAGGVPALAFFSGVPPAPTTANPAPIFAPNITPHDPTGIAGWTAADVVTAIKLGKNTANRPLCGGMANAVKGYAGMSDADAHAIGVYLTTIPGVRQTRNGSRLPERLPDSLKGATRRWFAFLRTRPAAGRTGLGVGVRAGLGRAALAF